MVRKQSKKKGFTLIELSIVLIIIGLLVGGILVGQDLIEGARIRAQINQINSYDTALNTFQLKYSAVPGDCSRCSNDGFGIRGATATHDGDGDGTIEGNLAGGNLTAADGAGTEAAFAFIDLSGAGLVDGSYTITDTSPDAEIEPVSIALVGAGGSNFFILGATDATDTVCAAGSCITPFTAWTLDTKMDDGVGTTGSTTLLGNTTAAEDITDGDLSDDGTIDADCATTGVYDISDTTNADCPLAIRTTL